MPTIRGTNCHTVGPGARPSPADVQGQVQSYRTLTDGLLVTLSKENGKRVASDSRHPSAKGAVHKYRGQGGETVFVSHLNGRLSAAARGRDGKLREVGYVTHKQEIEEGVAIRQFGYISIQPALRGKKLGNLLLHRLAEEASANGEPLIRVCKPDPALDERFWKPAGLDIDGSKIYYFNVFRGKHATRPWMGGEAEELPTDEEMAGVVVLDADGPTGEMYFLNLDLAEAYWHPPG